VTARRLHTAARPAARRRPIAATTAATALKASAWELTVSRHAILLSPRPRPGCPDCRGEGGRWSEGPYPGGELCWCWDRPSWQIPLLPLPAFPGEPPF